jgi:hypothetical protein
MAQSFTIRRPADGSTVRETVNVLIPKGSIPDGSYIGVVVNGKFLEAAMPVLDGDNFVYKLDTKARRIPDGDMDLEVVLYTNYSDRVEVSNRSSVRVKLDNYTSIKVPDEGFTLRYKFQPGKELVYKQTVYQSAGMVSQGSASLGSRAGEVPLKEESRRILYAFDNVYGPNAALLRMQGLPEKGKNYAYLTVAGNTEPTKYFDFQMHPIYMKISGTGRELEGSVPAYFPLEGTAGDASKTDLYSVAPLPMLPEEPLMPGESWNAAHLFRSFDIDNAAETNRITRAINSRGTLLGVEWEQGIPCAKFSVSLDAGPRDLTNAVNLGDQPGEATRVTLEGVVWFSLDQGVIVKSELNYLQESLVTVGTPESAAGGGAAGQFSGGGGPALGGASSTGGTGGAPGTGMSNFIFDPHIGKDGIPRFFRQGRPGLGGQGPGGVGQPGGASNPGGQAGAPGFGQRPGGGSGSEQKMLLRVRLRLLTQLEK